MIPNGMFYTLQNRGVKVSDSLKANMHEIHAYDEFLIKLIAFIKFYNNRTLVEAINYRRGPDIPGNISKI